MYTPEVVISALLGLLLMGPRVFIPVLREETKRRREASRDIKRRF